MRPLLYEVDHCDLDMPRPTVLPRNRAKCLKRAFCPTKQTLTWASSVHYHILNLTHFSSISASIIIIAQIRNIDREVEATGPENRSGA